MFEQIRNHDRSMSNPTTTMISKNRASTNIDAGPVQKIVLTTSFARRVRFFLDRFSNSLLTPMLCLQLSTVLRVFNVVMLWQPGARRQGETGGVGTGVGANCANHGD